MAGTPDANGGWSNSFPSSYQDLENTPEAVLRWVFAFRRLMVSLLPKPEAD